MNEHQYSTRELQRVLKEWNVLLKRQGMKVNIEKISEIMKSGQWLELQSVREGEEQWQEENFVNISGSTRLVDG